MFVRSATVATIIGLLAPGASGVAFAQASGSGAATGSVQYSADDLDKVLAPIALYPDALIVQILQCAASPYQVRQVNDWLKQHPDLNGTAAQEAATQEGFDASFVAIVIFPDVLANLADQPDWTRDLGQAFTTNRDGVFAAVQRLRKEAQDAGNLKSNQQQQVQTVTADGGQQVIVVQPANPQVVYVPQYDPNVVYTQPASSTSSGDVAAAGIIGFAAGVIVGAVADNDDDHYYYACGGWGYARPICYPGGYNNYYQHRENMANDYYDHRENMAGLRGDNRADRQGNVSDNRSQRLDTRSSNRGTVSDNRSGRQSTRSDTRSTANQDRSQARTTRQQEAGQGSWQGRGSTTSRGAYQGASRDAYRGRSGTNSGAFSGYQRGSTERASSSRGRSSMQGRGGSFNRGGGGGRSRGGGRRR